MKLNSFRITFRFMLMRPNTMVYTVHNPGLFAEAQELQKTLLEQRKQLEEEERIKRNKEFEAERLARKQRKEQEEAELEQARIAAEEEETRLRHLQAEELRQKRLEKVKKDEEHHRRMMQEQQAQQQPLRPAPKLVRRDSFKAVNDTSRSESQRRNDGVRTGYVNEKRNFWMRSASTDRLHQRHEMSPGPRRRRIGGGEWIRSETTPEPCSRPGSSLGQVITATGNVKHTVNNWGTLSKSRSSAAVLQEPLERPRSRLMDSWAMDHDERAKSVERKVLDPHGTNQVQDTVSNWAKAKEASGRTTPVPSRTIGETFADSQVQKWGQTDEELLVRDGPTPWRTKTPEPGLKLLNVSVEKKDSNNVHISENAHAQMSSYATQDTSYKHNQIIQQESKAYQQLKMEQAMMMETESKMERSSKIESKMESEQKLTRNKEQTAMRSSDFSKSEQTKKEAKSEQKVAKFTEQTAMRSSAISRSEQTKKEVKSEQKVAKFTEQTAMRSSAISRSEQTKKEVKSEQKVAKLTEQTASRSSNLSKQEQTTKELQQVQGAEQESQKVQSLSEVKKQDFKEVQLPVVAPKKVELTKPSEAVRAVQVNTEPIAAPAPPPPPPKPKKEAEPAVTITEAEPFEMQPPKTAKKVDTKPVKSYAIPSNTNYLQSSERSTSIAPNSPSLNRARFSTPDRNVKSMQTATQTVEEDQQQILPVPVNESWYEGSNKGEEDLRSTTPMPVLSEWFKDEGKDQEEAKRKAEEKVRMEEAYKREKEKAVMEAKKKIEEEVRLKKLEELQMQEELLKQEQATLEAKVEQVLEEQSEKRPPKKGKMSKTDLEHMQKKRLDEYRRAQDILSGNESQTSEEQQRDHEQRINEQKLLEDAMKGKVRGNIAMFSRQSVERDGSEPRSLSRGPTRVKTRETFVRQRTTSEDREEAEKLQRSKELELVASARANSNWDEDGDDEMRREQSSTKSELCELAAIRSNSDKWEEVTDAEERARMEKEVRSRELLEITATRAKPNWEKIVSTSHSSSAAKSHEMELEEARATIRGAATLWQEREMAQNKQRAENRPPVVPTRRIGNLFSHNSNQWRMDDDEEEFPAPPTQDEVNNALFEEYLNDCYKEDQEASGGRGTPAPPPRDSSKDFMMEFHSSSSSRDGGPWHS